MTIHLIAYEVFDNARKAYMSGCLQACNAEENTPRYLNFKTGRLCAIGASILIEDVAALEGQRIRTHFMNGAITIEQGGLEDLSELQNRHDAVLCQVSWLNRQEKLDDLHTVLFGDGSQL